MKLKLLLCLALALSGVGHAALIYPAAPDGGLELINNRISEFHPGDTFFGRLKMEDVVVARPYRLYYVGLDDLISGRLLEVPAPGKDWQYYLMGGTNVLGAAIIIETATNQVSNLKLNDLGVFGKSDGDLEKTQAFLQTLENWPQVRKEDYEFRMLNVPGLSFQAIWLHAKTDDIIIPLPWFSNPIITPYQPYSEKQLVKILKPKAERNMKMWQALRDQEAHNKNAYERAMTDYEKAHGNKCGFVSRRSEGQPARLVEPNIMFCQLGGMSSACGLLSYNVKITYKDHFATIKKVEVLEKITPVKLKVVKVDSEETGPQNGYGANAVDGDPNTYWHTQWQSNSPGLPHEITIELFPPSVIKGFTYLPRQDVSDHGTIKDYEFYVSDDGTNFGQPVSKGTFYPGKEESPKEFVPVKCRFIKLRALSEITGQPWASAAEIHVIEKDQLHSGRDDYWRGNLEATNRSNIIRHGSAKPDALDTFVAMLSADGGLWQNGADAINGIRAETPEEVVSETLRTAKFEAGMLTSYRIDSLRKVHIGQFPEIYTAALLDTNLGRMVMLMQYTKGNDSTPGHWWRRIYDANPPIRRLY